MAPQPILSVENLVTAFDTEAGKIRAVDDISFTVSRGQTVGIVGESGCGKSVTALSIMRLLPKPAGAIESGAIRLDQLEITRLPAERMHEIRGNRISMIFQEPMTALNPVHKIGQQLKEVYRLHRTGLTEGEIHTDAVEMLRRVSIPEPVSRMHEYPHQLSGGMRQRIIIAMALACHPDLLIADEPTTALDVTIQAQILKLMQELQRDTEMAIIFITHNLGVVAEVCDEVLVMYAGKLAERAPVAELFQNPKHPYTLGLLSSIPRLEQPPKVKLKVIRGRVPTLYELPDGCRFSNRCPYAMPGCQIAPPPLMRVAQNHWASCYLYPSHVPPI